MSQTTNAQFDAARQDRAKAVDYILAISGWPTLYSLASTYSIPGSGDLSQFASVRQWMVSAPKGAAAKVKARPEEGDMTIGQISVEVQDRTEDGTRKITDLLSRQAHLEGTSSGATTTLNGNITRSATSITLTSGAGFSQNDVVYIGNEAIRLGDKSGNTFGGVTPCVRGYRLTPSMPHLTGVKVYGFMPNLYTRPAYLFKGFTHLTLDKFLRAFGGPIVNDEMEAAEGKFDIASMTWQAYADGRTMLFDGDPFDGVQHPGDTGTTTGDVLPGDYTINLSTSRLTAAELNTGRYWLSFGPYAIGIRGAT